MCTNLTPTKRAQWVKEKLGVDLPSGYPDESYPGFVALVVVKSHQTSRVACGLARFGLIPSWAKDDKISRHTYIARSETVAEKPSYRNAWRRRQFGLVLCTLVAQLGVDGGTGGGTNTFSNKKTSVRKGLKGLCESRHGKGLGPFFFVPVRPESVRAV